MPTFEFWSPATNNYSLGATSFRVLTNNEHWHNAEMEAVPFPAGFRADISAALTYLNATPTGQHILNGITLTGRTVTFQPSSVGNSVAFGNEQALNRVALELLTGDRRPGAQVTNALNAAGINAAAQATWLHLAILQSPEWALDRMPGSNNGFFAMMQSARLRMNTYLLWSDTNEGYFSNQSWFRNWGIGPYTNSIRRQEVTQWLAGQANALARLSDRERNHAYLATIAALRPHATANVGSDCNVAWDNNQHSVSNLARPPAIGLGHELVHAFYSCRGEQCGRDVGHYSTVLFEYQCVGLGPWDEDFPSENSLRHEWPGILGQIPLGDTLNRRTPPKRIQYD